MVLEENMNNYTDMNLLNNNDQSRMGLDQSRLALNSVLQNVSLEGRDE